MQQFSGFDPNFNFFDNYAKNNERKLIKKNAGAIGVGYILAVIFNVILGVGAGFILQAIGKSHLISDPYFTQVIQVVGSLVMLVPPFIIAAKIAKIKPSRAIPMGAPKEKGIVLPILLSGYGVCLLANLIGGICSTFLENFGLHSEVDFNLPDGPVGFVVSVLTIALLPALLEEFAYRGVVLALLRPFGNGFAVVVSGAMFGLMHGNMAQIPFAVIVGIALSYITVRTGSIWPSVALHFINNFVSVLLTSITESMPEVAVALINMAWMSISALCAIIGVALLSQKKFSFALQGSAKTKLRAAQKVSAFASSPAIIIALAITALEIILNFVMSS